MRIAPNGKATASPNVSAPSIPGMTHRMTHITIATSTSNGLGEDQTGSSSESGPAPTGASAMSFRPELFTTFHPCGIDSFFPGRNCTMLTGSSQRLFVRRYSSQGWAMAGSPTKPTGWLSCLARFLDTSSPGRTDRQKYGIFLTSGGGECGCRLSTGSSSLLAGDREEEPVLLLRTKVDSRRIHPRNGR